MGTAVDPFKLTPGLNDPAHNLFLIIPSDTESLAVGIKAMRIWNPNATAAIVKVTTKVGNVVSFRVPALSLWTEPLMVLQVWETGTDPALEIHGYTDIAVR